MSIDFHGLPASLIKARQYSFSIDLHTIYQQNWSVKKDH